MFFKILVSFACALYLPNMKKDDLEGKTIAYYPGSFDPIHLGHQNNIQESLKHVDYVLIYPSYDSKEKKKHTPQHARFEMIKTLYHNNPRVIWTDQTPGQMQELFKPLKNVVFWGIVGSDRALQMQGKSDEERKKYLSIWMQGVDFKNLPEHLKGKENKFTEGEYGVVSVFKAQQLILSTRKGDDLTPLNGKVGNMPIAFVIESKDHEDASSTKVRKAVKDKASIKGMVGPEIEEMVQQNYAF
jgi:cytidyltransferase-like protein